MVRLAGNLLILDWFPDFMGDNLETRKRILTLKAVIPAVIDIREPYGAV